MGRSINERAASPTIVLARSWEVWGFDPLYLQGAMDARESELRFQLGSTDLIHKHAIDYLTDLVEDLDHLAVTSDWPEYALQRIDDFYDTYLQAYEAN